MHEPWQCGKLIGHSSGGGILYNSYVALFRYAFPAGELPGMLWRQRFGDYKNNKPCRTWWTQSVLQLAFLGGEHSSTAESPQGISPALKTHFKKSYYATRRGLLIARSSLSDKATYMHFDARPDAFFLGHDNADRGVFTFTALRHTWIDDLPWSQNQDSRKHSLMHIDGLAQDSRAPSVKMLAVKDENDVVIAAADLTYAYNVQWARGHNHNSPPSRPVTVYDDMGISSKVTTLFPDPETSSPWALGWPTDDSAADLGFSHGMTLNGLNNIGFQGIWMWKRPYRQTPISHIVRSSVLVRSPNTYSGYGIIVDSVSAAPGLHKFESYLILHPSVSVRDSASHCAAATCKIVLSVGGHERLDIHVMMMGTQVSYRTESFGGNKKRLIITSVNANEEEFWLVMHPHEGITAGFTASRLPDGTTTITADGQQRIFHVKQDDFSVSLVSQ